ncbi:Uncharacterized [Syntrophomonas zehnderi OL-4]|uniref:Uncharacterized n=1 Tax=Syntrophomonas zehnderi OL-4 TaxID=690567 RepID=A0A0E4G9I3_9FIRM|nr:hypothetical protein [Syntrophomonas zehnderi]CFX15474.1 Uncharacterized [Syntrophomonas zehnderi OL-4]
MFNFDKFCKAQCPYSYIEIKEHMEPCINCPVSTFLDINDELEQIIKSAHYWLSSNRPRGQAETTLKCGHVDRLGAPMCKSCTKKALNSAIRAN